MTGSQTQATRSLVGGGLQRLLWTVFLLFALLLINSIYLASITLLEYLTGTVYQDAFYLSMFLLHLLLGLLLLLPFLSFGLIQCRQ